MTIEQALRQSLDALALHLYQPHGGHSKGTDFIADLAHSIEARLEDQDSARMKGMKSTLEDTLTFLENVGALTSYERERQRLLTQIGQVLGRGCC
jgi:hypothetical protein